MKTYSYKELENEKFIKLSNEYLNSKFIKKHNIDSILILSILLKNYTNRGEIVFSLNYLLDELRIKRTNTNRINKVKHILNSLAVAKVLNTDIDFTAIKNDDIVRVDYDLVDKNFTIVNDFEVKEILNADTKVDMYAMFYLFVFIKYRLNTSTKVMYWSIKDMAREMNTKSNKTVLNYTNVLEDIGLIKKGNVGMRVFADNSTKKANNIYGLGYLEDTDAILQKQMDSYKEQLEEKQIRVEKGKKQSEQTSVKLRLNSLWKIYHDGDITDDEIEELKKLQKKYYEFIKLDEEKVENTPFIIFDDDEVVDEVVTDEVITEKEPKKHFGKPNPMRKVDYETGEIISDIKTDDEQNVSDIAKTGSFAEPENDNWDEEVDLKDMIDDLLGVKGENIEITCNYDNESDNDTSVVCSDSTQIEYSSSEQEIIEKEIDNFRSFYKYIDIETCKKLFETDEEIQYVLSSTEFIDADVEDKHQQCHNMLVNSLEKLNEMQLRIDRREESKDNYIPNSIRYTQEQEFHNNTTDIDEDEILDLMS